MLKATYQDKALVTGILTRSFINNKSVNYIVQQDQKKMRRIQALMDYSFEVCMLFGEVFVSENRKACALILYPEKKRTTLKTLLLDVQLMLRSVGIRNVKKVLDREAKMEKIKPKTAMTYLWFIGVEPDQQHKGTGSQLLQGIIAHSSRPLYLETSASKNLPWYGRFGFHTYAELDLGYKIYFLKKEKGIKSTSSPR